MLKNPLGNLNDLERGFINKNKILEYVSEEEIFELVFGFTPVEYEYTTSPFRKDSNPGCWFQYSLEGSLRFVDFGNPSVIKGIKMKNIDCFDAVMVFYKLPNFYRTLEFIQKKLLTGDSNLLPRFQKKDINLEEKKKVEIHIQPRDFEERDKKFWVRYGISKKNLIDDKVFPVYRYQMLNSKKGDFIKKVNEVAYSYHGFAENRKKLYFPYRKGAKRFLTTCTKDDIGELNSLPEEGDVLVISKSYKDCRVLKNQGLDSIWFQNEGMIPSDLILSSLCKRFYRVVVFFDNDSTGIRASQKVKSIINNFYVNKATNIYLPESLNTDFNVTDPADMYHRLGKNNLQTFIKEKITLL